MEDILSLQFKGIPDSVFVYSFMIASLLIAVALFRKEPSKIKRDVLLILLVEYFFLVVSSTVLFRSSSPDLVRLELRPFWKYKEIASFGNKSLFWEVLLNVSLYIPIGMLLGLLIEKKSIIKVLLIGAVLSSSIEIAQFLLHRGLCETDDVINNTLGCVIGYCVVRILYGIRKLVK